MLSSRCASAAAWERPGCSRSCETVYRAITTVCHIRRRQGGGLKVQEGRAIKRRSSPPERRGRPGFMHDGLLDRVGDFLAVRTAEPGAGVPPRGGGKAAVVALRYIMQSRGIYVQVGVDDPGAPGLCRVDARDETGPQRRHGTRSADDGILAVDPHIVSSCPIGIPADVGNAPHRERLRRTRGFPNLQSLLIGRQRNKAADATAGRAVAGSLVPHLLLRDRGAGGL